MSNPIVDEIEDQELPGKSDPMQKVRDNFKLADEYWSDERREALDDIKFRAGQQWPSEIVSQREKDKRPCLVVDKLGQYVRQIVGDGRQNRPSIKVSPVDSKADIATAEIFSGIVKHIESRSNADAAYDTALDSAATGGFGYFTVTTEYSGDETFDQDICIKRVRNPLSIIIDPESTEADGSDMKFAFVIETMTKDAFETKYPNKLPADFETNDKYEGWYGDEIRVARYWEVVEEDRTLYQMVDGTVISKARFDELKEGGLIEIDSMVKSTRNIPVRRVMHSLVSGAEYLEEPQEWLGKYIPVCVVWGNEIDIEGKVTHNGIIRPAKDAQRLYNYSRSAFAERVALTPKAPWLAAEGQVEDYEDEWNTANTVSHSVLRYKPTSLNGQPVPPPQRVNPSDIPQGFQADMQISEHDIQGAIGMYASSLGAPSNERSGKAIMARQREGDTGTFHYHDNLNRAIRHCGRIIVDLIPKIYDSTRVVRIMGYDGTMSEASLNPEIPTASQKQGLQMMYNLGVGTYDVSITSGPSYNTLRQEATESMVTLIQAHPELMNVIGDLMVKNMDWPGAEEISKRLHMILPPQILEAEQKSKMDKMPPEMQQAIEQFDAVVKQKDEAINAAADKIEELMAELKEAKSEAQIKLAQAEAKTKEVEIKEKELVLSAAETEIKAFDSETKRMEAMSKIQMDKSNANIAELSEFANAAPVISPILQSLMGLAEGLQMNANKTSRPKIKRAKAVKQPDGSWDMEAYEHEAPEYEGEGSAT